MPSAWPLRLPEADDLSRWPDDNRAGCLDFAARQIVLATGCVMLPRNPTQALGAA